MAEDAVPPIISIIGRRNSGKTTLLVALAAELRRRGLRVASIKHSHHDFEMDHPGKDSWRHVHEGGVEAVVLASPHSVGVVMRTEGADRDPVLLARRFLSGQGYDVVLVEAFKQAPLPRIEIFRTPAHPTPLYEPGADDPRAPYLAIVTDAPASVQAACPVLPLDPHGRHAETLAVIVLRHLAAVPPAAGG
jgi:molybdopterin-guanine dinucleotide biosynthesis protein MobB